MIILCHLYNNCVGLFYYILPYITKTQSQYRIKYDPFVLKNIKTGTPVQLLIIYLSESKGTQK